MRAHSLLMISVIALGAEGCGGPQPVASFVEPRPLGREVTPAADPAGPYAPGEEPVGPITRAEAAALALRGNPDLAAGAWGIRAADAQKLGAGLYPNPEASVEIEEFSGDRRGFREAETTLAISQRLLLGGAREASVRVGELGRDLAAWEFEAARLDLVTEVTRAFARLLGAQREVEIAEEAAAIAEEIVATVGRRVDAGAASPVERIRAGVSLASARASLERSRQDVRAARVRLAAMWGSARPRFSRAEGELDIGIAVPPLPELEKRLSGNPEVMRAAVEVRRRAAALEREKSLRIPDVTLRAGYRRLEAERADTFVAGIAVPLPLFDRNQGGVLEAEARLAAAERERLGVELRARASLAEVHAAVVAAQEERRAFKEKILPGARAAYDAVREGYREGRFTYVDLLTAQSDLAEKRSAFVRALLRLNEASSDLERLIGEPVETDR